MDLLVFSTAIALASGSVAKANRRVDSLSLVKLSFAKITRVLCLHASYAEMNLSDVCEELNEIRDVFSFQNTCLGFA